MAKWMVKGIGVTSLYQSGLEFERGFAELQVTP